MKLKRFLTVLVILVALLSLCSCKDLDTLKEQYAYYFKDENGVECISYNDHTYLPYKTKTQNVFFIMTESQINVTHVPAGQKVPLLLSDNKHFSDKYYMVKGGKIFATHNQADDCYVREDYYESFERLMNYNDLYFCSLSLVNNETVITRLSDELTNVINEIITNGKPFDVSNYDNYNRDEFWYITSINMCDKDEVMFVGDATYLYICKYENDYVLERIYDTIKADHRLIPKEYLPLFESAFEDMRYYS